MWRQMSAISPPQHRAKRAWLFGQWVDNSGYESQPPRPTAQPPPGPEYRPEPVVNPVSTPVVQQSCCTCHQGPAGAAGEPGNCSYSLSYFIYAQEPTVTIELTALQALMASLAMMEK